MKTFLAHSWLVLVYMKTQWQRIVRGALRENFYFMGFKHRIHVSDARRLSSSLDDTDARDEAIYAGLFLVHLMITHDNFASRSTFLGRY